MWETLTGILGPAEWQAVRLSLRVSFWATFLSLPFGILVAYLLARGNFPGKQLLNGVVHLPLILPPVVTGYLLLLGFGRRGPIGGVLETDFWIPVFFLGRGAAVCPAGGLRSARPARVETPAQRSAGPPRAVSSRTDPALARTSC